MPDIIILTFWIPFYILENDVQVLYILVQKGKNDPYYALGQKRARLMKEYLLSDRCADLEILMTGGLKPKYIICI